MKFLIDTGTSRNFIKPINILVGVIPLKNTFNVNSINGTNLITEKCGVVVFGYVTTFFVLPSLKNFDGIIGYDFLRRINARINIGNDTLSYKRNEDPIVYKSPQKINFMNIDKTSVPDIVKPDFDKILKTNQRAFADPIRTLPYNTNVEANISTKNDEPIYSKSYPYPVQMSDFVNKEIEALLKDGIIRKSFSPLQRTRPRRPKKRYR